MPKPSVSKCRPVFLTAMKGRYEAVKEPDQSLLNLLFSLHAPAKNMRSGSLLWLLNNIFYTTTAFTALFGFSLLHGLPAANGLIAEPMCIYDK